MEALGITGVEAFLLGGAVIGFVEFVKRLFEKDWRAAIIIFGSALLGGLISLFPEMSFTFLTGVIGGLAATGYFKLGQEVGKQKAGTIVAESLEIKEAAKRK